MKREAKNLEEMKGIALDFLQNIVRLPATGEALVVGLSGDLGAGKTAFTKCVAEILGVTDIITSPTFILEKIYPINENSFFGSRIKKLVHIDAYRLDDGREMSALDWGTVIKDEHALVLLEWPEQVASALPRSIINLSFEHVDEGVRSVSGKYIT